MAKTRERELSSESQWKEEVYLLKQALHSKDEEIEQVTERIEAAMELEIARAKEIVSSEMLQAHQRELYTQSELIELLKEKVTARDEAQRAALASLELKQGYIEQLEQQMLARQHSR